MPAKRMGWLTDKCLENNDLHGAQVNKTFLIQNFRGQYLKRIASQTVKTWTTHISSPIGMHRHQFRGRVFKQL